MKNYKIFLAPKDETWQQSLVRFQKFCEADMKEYFLVKDYSYQFAHNNAYHLHFTHRVLHPFLALLEAQRGIKIPAPYTSLLSEQGAFAIGDGIFEIFDGVAYSPIMSLAEVLYAFGKGDFVDKIKPRMLKSINEFYFFFGVSFRQTDELSFLFFSKAGNFGKLHFSDSNHNYVLDCVLPSMFNGSVDRFSLDALISNQIDRIIINALTVKGYV